MSEHTLQDGTPVAVGDVLIFHVTADLALPWLMGSHQEIAEDWRDDKIDELRDRGVIARPLYLNSSDAGPVHDVWFDVELEIVGFSDPKALQAGFVPWVAIAFIFGAVSLVLITYEVTPTIDKAIDAFDPGRPLPPGEETVGTHLGDSVASAFKSSAVVAVAGAVVVLLFFLWSRKNNE